MKFIINRETLLPVLQGLSGVVDRRPKMEALSSVLWRIDSSGLLLTTSDSDVELSCRIDQNFPETAKFLVGARKLLDICRSLPEETDMEFHLQEQKVLINAARSRFRLLCYPSEDFPLMSAGSEVQEFRIDAGRIHRMIVETQFSMANQDVRYYLNGLLLEVRKDGLSLVATDGHRLAFSEERSERDWPEQRQIIIPRKGVSELSRILSGADGEIVFRIGVNHIHLDTGDSLFISKLIDGQYPDYRRVVPEVSETPLSVDREELRLSLIRVSTLDPDRRRGVEMNLGAGTLGLHYKSPENEEVSVEMDVQYEGEAVRTGFNAQYLLDVLSVMEDEQVHVSLRDAESSCLISGSEDKHNRYVIMPLHL